MVMVATARIIVMLMAMIGMALTTTMTARVTTTMVRNEANMMRTMMMITVAAKTTRMALMRRIGTMTMKMYGLR